MIKVILSSSLIFLVIVIIRKIFRGKTSNVFLYSLWLLFAAGLVIPIFSFALRNIAGWDSKSMKSPVSIMNFVEIPTTDTETTVESVKKKENSTKKEKKKAQINKTDINNNQSVIRPKEVMKAKKVVSFRTLMESWQLKRVLFIIWVIGALTVLLKQLFWENAFRRQLIENREETVCHGQKVYKTKGNIFVTIFILLLLCTVGVAAFTDAMEAEKKPVKEKQISSNQPEQEKMISVKKAEYEITDMWGTDAPLICYEDDTRMIFSGYFGLFIYSKEKEEIIQSLNLKEIGCNMTQGDHYCSISASEDGKIVYLHVMSDEKKLQWIETHFSNPVEEIKGVPACSFYHMMYLKRKDGVCGKVFPATDSCSVYQTGKSYYEYKKDTNGEFNEEFWELFGIEDIKDIR